MSECLEVKSNPARWRRENVDEIRCRRMDMCTYSLMYALEIGSFLYREFEKKKHKIEVFVLEIHLKILIGSQ